MTRPDPFPKPPPRDEQPESLTTFAPVIEDAGRFWPTGNLLVSLPELDEHGHSRSINIVSEAERGVVAAVGDMLAPTIAVDGVERPLSLTWTREADWIPRAEALVDGGAISIEWLTPVSREGRSEPGLAARLVYRNETALPQSVRLGWRGAWDSTVVHHFRAKQLDLALRTRDDAWTGCRAVYAGAERLLLSLSWRPGEGAAFDAAQPANGWSCAREAAVEPGRSLELDVFVGVATEPDGSGAMALFLRRTGFDALRAETVSWLESHGPRFTDAPVERVARRNAFFSHFYAQADCLDTGRTVLLTSRSPRYYVSGAFWSRDAYWWSFPALLLVDPVRARRALVASLENAGENIADHALYITGQRMYPGFELDELVAPVLALWRYVQATGDYSVMEHPLMRGFVATIDRGLAAAARQTAHGVLYATILLPTDDPTDFPLTATGNALVAVAMTALGGLLDELDRVEAGRLLRDTVLASFVRVPAPGAPARWAWALDLDGTAEWRDEPPLGLRLLPYLGVPIDGADAASDAFAETLQWLTTDYPFHYPGAFPGAGAPHFASPSSFDLGNRVLTGNQDLGDPLAQLVATPMDTGIACESWDPSTGVVVTGAAMASVAGYLAWTAWADAAGHRRWDDPFPLPTPGAAAAAASTTQEKRR